MLLQQLVFLHHNFCWSFGMPGTLSRGYARRGGAVAVAGGGAKRSEVLLTTLAFFCLCWATFALLCYKVADVGGGRRPGGGTALSLSRKLISGSQSSSRGGHRQHASHRSPTSASSTTSGSSSSRAGHRKAARRASQTQGRRGQAPQRRASDDAAAAAAATGGGGNSGDLPFASASNCTRLGTRRFVLQDGRTVTPTIERIGSEWIFKYNRDVRYTHMATIEALPGVGLVCAWQAAPSSKVDGKFQPAVEGLGTLLQLFHRRRFDLERRDTRFGPVACCGERREWKRSPVEPRLARGQERHALALLHRVEGGVRLSEKAKAGRARGRPCHNKMRKLEGGKANHAFRPQGQ